MPQQRGSYILCLVAIVLVLAFLVILMEITPHKEGFESNTQEMSKQLLANVMPPIRRLSSMLLNPNVWMERITQMHQTPTEMAREYLRKQNPM